MKPNHRNTSVTSDTAARTHYLRLLQPQGPQRLCTQSYRSVSSTGSPNASPPIGNPALHWGWAHFGSSQAVLHNTRGANWSISPFKLWKTSLRSRKTNCSKPLNSTNSWAGLTNATAVLVLDILKGLASSLLGKNAWVRQQAGISYSQPLRTWAQTGDHLSYCLGKQTDWLYTGHPKHHSKNNLGSTNGAQRCHSVIKMGTPIKV